MITRKAVKKPTLTCFSLFSNLLDNQIIVVPTDKEQQIKLYLKGSAGNRCEAVSSKILTNNNNLGAF